jgi:hypothetical protein
MPASPLSVELSARNTTIWSAIVTGAGVAIIFLLGAPLKNPTSRATGEAAQTGEISSAGEPASGDGGAGSSSGAGVPTSPAIMSR